LAFKTRASCLRYVILPICFFFLNENPWCNDINNDI
jgi:hypothetical protein